METGGLNEKTQQVLEWAPLLFSEVAHWLHSFFPEALLEETTIIIDIPKMLHKSNHNWRPKMFYPMEFSP